MNAHVFRRVSEALAPRLFGARLEKIHSLAPEVTQWSLYGHGERFNLILRAHKHDPFLFLAGRRTPVGAEPPPLIMRFRKYLAGQRVTAVFTDWPARRLWLRFAPGTDVWLCLDLREGPALFWEEPEALAAPGSAPIWPPPDVWSEPDAWRAWPVLSPLLRRTLPLLPQAEQLALMADLEDGGGDLFVYEDTERAPEISAWPLPEPLRGGRRERVFEDPLEAASLAGERLVLRGLAREASIRAAKPHAAEAERLERLLRKLDQEEARLAAMAASRADGLALQTELYRFGQAEKRPWIEVETREGARRIELDPLLTVRENMAALFHRSGRGQRGLALLAGRRETVRAELAEARMRAGMAAGLAPVCASGLGKAAGQGSGVRSGMDARGVGAGTGAGIGVGRLPKGVQAFQSSDGLLILRGRDAAGNLAALKMGRPDDVWLHAEGAAGAHVILRRQPGQDVPERSLHEAGMLAVLKSPYRDAGTAAIQCAQVRHVHPMRGAKAGTVRIDRHEPGFAVRIEPDIESRLTVSGTSSSISK